MKIIFFGEDSFSNVVLQSLIDAKFDVVLVVSPFYDNLIHKRLEKTSLVNHIEYIRIADFKAKSFIIKLSSLLPDLIVIAHFKKLIQREIINIPNFGCINLHPSLLPYYRGLSPQHWPIINGEHETGVSVHFVDEHADTGDIILQKKVQITSNMYVSDLQLEFIKVYKTIVIESINLIKQQNFIPMKQSHLKGTYYGKLKREQCKIDLSQSRNRIINLIRGVSKPYYGAYLDDIIIWKARIANKFEDDYFRKNSEDKIGLNFSDPGRPYLFLKDGSIIIEKYEKNK
jgi:methionyl-tRNA formyltransferase